ncbi:hypothetical protein Tco_1023793 [Tanacetum coccineum]
MPEKNLISSTSKKNSGYLASWASIEYVAPFILKLVFLKHLTKPKNLFVSNDPQPRSTMVRAADLELEFNQYQENTNARLTTLENELAAMRLEANQRHEQSNQRHE